MMANEEYMADLDAPKEDIIEEVVADEIGRAHV